MKTRYSVKWMLVGTLLSWGLTACSFGGGDEEQAEVTTEEGAEGGEGNVAEAPAEGEGGENAAVEGENANLANTNGAEMENVDGSNATDGNFSNSEIPPELLNSDTATAGAEMNNTNIAGAEGMGEVPMDNAAMPAADATIPAPTDAMAAAPAPEAVPAAPAAVPPSGDMRVYYVSVESGTIRNAPDASGSSVGSVSKGDPLLVKIEGEWANVANRGYIEVAHLSQAPVGRTTAPKAWQ